MTTVFPYVYSINRFIFVVENLLLEMCAQRGLGLSRWTLKFHPGAVHVGFVLNKVALGEVLTLVLRFATFRIILSMLHSYLHLRLLIHAAMKHSFQELAVILM
jgi:hypothetical protein